MSMSLETARTAVRALGELKAGEGCFIPTLRTAVTLAAAYDLAQMLRRRFSYRVTVVDNKFGILFTRSATSYPAGLRNEDKKES
jgi:hypothetical protein